MPSVVGLRGNLQAFDASMIAVLEPNGTAVEPASRYQAQCQMRLGKPLTHLFCDEWTAGFGLMGAEVDFVADPDSDLRRNLFEYAVGGIPIAGSNSLSELPAFRLIGNGAAQQPEYVYWRRRNAAALGLNWVVKLTGSLAGSTWSTDGAGEAGAAVINDDFESVTNRGSTPGNTSRLIRLGVEITQ